jgi:serine/threonine-protein kinase
MIGGYRILRKIGEGGMGAVYLAEHALLGRRAAVKLLRSTRTNGDTEKRFLNEARAISLLSDPGIVQIYDYGHAPDGQAYLVMELLVGQDMNHRLREIQRFDLATGLGFSQQICRALEVAHRAGIVHRDLKPANVFLTGTPERVKLLDFGVAKLLGDFPDKPSTQAGMLMGTPAYMSRSSVEPPATSTRAPTSIPSAA